ncbi:MAG: protein NO VEIN domain-containing protein [Candidatus Nanohaloarchaea archaeon]
MSEMKVDLNPNKDLFLGISRDLNYIEAVKELIDNSIDNWTRRTSRSDDVKIEIECDDGKTIIRDNTGGISRDDINSVIAPGENAEEISKWSIGGFSLGAKRAIPKLADYDEDVGDFQKATIKSNKNGEEGYGYTIDREWFRHDEWVAEWQSFDIPKGVTEIEIESRNRIWDEGLIEELKRDISKTYTRFLNNEARDQSGELNIIVNGVSLENEESVDWSYIPIDGLHPRRYEGIEISEEDVRCSFSDPDNPIQMSVTVGLMTELSDEDSGTDIYCQDRLVVGSNKGTVGGYTEDKIGNWNWDKKRFKLIVELSTEGDSTDLPWNSTKSDISLDPPMRKIHEVLSHLVSKYFEAHAEKIPPAIPRRYSKDSEYPENDGKIEIIQIPEDVSMGMTPDNLDEEIEQVVYQHTPDEDLERIEEIKYAAELHGLDGVVVEYDEEYDYKYLSDISEYPAYEELVKDEYSGSDDVKRVSPSKGKDVIDRIESLEKDLKSVDGIGNSSVEDIVHELGLTSKEEIRREGKPTLSRELSNSKTKRILEWASPEGATGFESNETDDREEQDETDDTDKTDDIDNGWRDERDDTPSTQELRAITEEEAMVRVIEYEKENGANKVQDVSSEGRGYDVMSERDGSLRKIEVKGFSGQGTVSLTKNEWTEAEKHGDEFWLYIVPDVEGEEKTPIYIIQNPREKLDANRTTWYTVSVDEWLKDRWKIKPEVSDLD